MKKHKSYYPNCEAAYNNALNCRSLRSLDVQKLRFWPPVSLIVIHLQARSVLRQIGLLGWGSIPLTLVGLVALLLLLLRYISLKLVLSTSGKSDKETPMKKTLTARTLVASFFETVWAIGVSGVVGHLSA